MREFLEPKQVQALMSYMITQRSNTQTILIEIIARTGCRSNEAMDITLQDVDLDGWLRITGSKRSNDRKAPIPKSLAQMLVVTLNQEPAWKLISNTKDSALRLLRTHWIKVRREALGYHAKDVTLHGLRTTFAVNVYKNAGKDVLLVQELLGHKSINSTMHYVKITQTEERANDVLRAASGKRKNITRAR
jgi:integrase